MCIGLLSFPWLSSFGVITSDQSCGDHATHCPMGRTIMIPTWQYKWVPKGFIVRKRAQNKKRKLTRVVKKNRSVYTALRISVKGEPPPKKFSLGVLLRACVCVLYKKQSRISTHRPPGTSSVRAYSLYGERCKLWYIYAYSNDYPVPDKR